MSSITTPPHSSVASTGHWAPCRAAGLLPNGHGGVAHHHQLKRAPAHQLHDVQHDGQAGKAPAIHRVHQPRAGQAAVAAQLGDPAQQPGAHGPATIAHKASWVPSAGIR